MEKVNIAAICHEANKALCSVYGDHSQKSWLDCEEWQRNSAIAGVEFAIANPDATPEAQHEAWSKDKRKDGWIYGEVKNAEKKTHPCLVPYSELPSFQKEKDILFQAIVRALKS